MLLTRGRRQLGHAIITDPCLGVEEIDTLTCYHCHHVIWTRPGKNWEYHCTCCDKFICEQCVGKGCTPLKKRLELIERARQNAREI